MPKMKECPAVFWWDFKEKPPYLAMEEMAKKCGKNAYIYDTKADCNLIIVGVADKKEAIETLINWKLDNGDMYYIEREGIDPTDENATKEWVRRHSKIREEDFNLYDTRSREL